MAAAERGISIAPRRSPIAARLHAKAARGHARQGNHAACTEMLDKARKLCDRLPDQVPSRLSTETSEHTSCTIAALAAKCHVWLGNWKEAERQARATLASQGTTPGWSEIAQLDLGIAMANLGSPDEAADHGKRTLSAGRWSGCTLPRARELDAALMSRYPTHPSVQGFHEEYQQFVNRALTN